LLQSTPPFTERGIKNSGPMFKYTMNIEHDALLLVSLAVAAEGDSRLSIGLLGIGSTLSVGVYAWINQGLYVDIVFPAGGQFF
jgi:hypothetical protein